MADESIIADLKSQGFDKLIQDLSLSAKGFTELDKSMAEAQKKLDTLDKSSQEFKDLTKEINAATIASKAYAESNDTLKKELRDTTNEIGNLERSIKALEKAGQTNTQTYKDLTSQQDTLRKKAGELKDTIGDLNQEIKNSGSDTRNLDKAVRAISTVASGYQVAQGALALYSGENKKFEQALLKLNAVMAITQGLQQIQEELSKRDSVFTQAAAKAKLLYASATQGATAAMTAFRLAMVALGIGAFIVAIGFLVANWDKLKTSIFGVTKTLDDYIASKEKSLALSQKALDLLEKELEYQIAIGAITEQRANEIRTDAIGKQLKAESEILKGQIKTYDDLKKKREEQGITSGFYITALIKSAFKVSKAEIESQKNAVLGQTQIVKDLTVKFIESQKQKEKKVKEDKIKIEKEGLDDSDKLSKQNLKRILDDLNAENELYNKFRRERKAQEELSLKNQKILEDERAKIILDTNQDNYTKRLEANQKLQDDLAEQNRQRQEDELQAEKEHIEKIGNLIGGLTDVANRIGNLASQAIEVRSQNEIRALDQRKQQGLISEKQYQKEMAKIKNEAARKQRTADIAMAFAMIPQAAFSAFTSTPGGIVVKSIAAALASAFGLAQVALIASAPLPQFRDGGQVSKKLGLIKGARHERGGVPIEVEGEEYVMPVEQTKENLPALEAMRKGKFNELFIPKQNVMQPDVFANIPNPSNIALPIVNEMNDYSSINKRLDKLASEMWWLGQYTKEGNKVRERGTEKIVKNLETQRKRYV